MIISEPLGSVNRRPIEYYEDGNGCYICTSHVPKNDGKYYHIMRDKIYMYLHRYIFELHNGKIPDGLMVRHKCDNCLCINYKHLETGTHKDNMNDMKSRGRSSKGEENGKSKLSNSQVEEIKVLLTEGKLSQAKIAEKFDVWQTMISHIKLGKYRN